MLRAGKVLCDIPECGRKATGGCEMRTDFSHSGHHTRGGDLVAWCEFHETDLREALTGECKDVTISQLEKMYVTKP